MADDVKKNDDTDEKPTTSDQGDGAGEDKPPEGDAPTTEEKPSA